MTGNQSKLQRKTNKPKHAGGRPTKYKYTEETLKLIENYAALGLPKEEIDFLLGISKTTRREWEKKYPEFANAIKRGQLRAETSVTKSLFDSATNGNVTAQIFFLCNRVPDRWKNVQRIDLGGLSANITDMTTKLNRVFESGEKGKLHEKKETTALTGQQKTEDKV